MVHEIVVAITSFISGLALGLAAGITASAYVIGKGIQAAEAIRRAAAKVRPVQEIAREFEIRLELDKDRVVEAGYAQAVREEAARIGRLN